MEEKVIDTTFEEKKEQSEKNICTDCGHRGFCKYEDGIGERIKNFSEALSGIKIEEPLVVGVHCMGFCLAVEKETK